MEAHVEESSGRGPLVVYTIVARERDGRKFWVRIGTAFKNRDGSLNAVLDAVPTNGTLHIRPFRAASGEGHRPAESSFPADLPLDSE